MPGALDRTSWKGDAALFSFLCFPGSILATPTVEENTEQVKIGPGSIATNLPSFLLGCLCQSKGLTSICLIFSFG
jgi:hypothetical protein